MSILFLSRCQLCLEATQHNMEYCLFLYIFVSPNKAQTGQAYMFSNAMNVVLGRKEDKQMITGIYTIAKIYCSNCGQELGWHYLRAYDLKQKWKEGNFIIEKFKMLKEYK